MMNFLNRLKEFFSWVFSKGVSTKKGRMVLGGVFLILCSLFIFRSCTHRKALHKEVYLIGRDSSWYSLQLYGRERALQAFINDLMAAIGIEAGIRFYWVETYPSALVEGLEAESYDAILSSLKPNKVNEERFLFSELLFELGPVLIVRKNSPITRLDDLNGRVIGVKAGSHYMFNALHEPGAHGFDLTFISYPNENRGMEALVNNQIDGFILEVIPAYTFVEGLYHDKLKVATAPLTDEGLRLIANMGKGEGAFISLFDEALEKVKQNGTYQFLIEKWGLINPETRYQVDSATISSKPAN